MSAGKWINTKRSIEKKRSRSEAFCNDWHSYESRVEVGLGGRKNYRGNTQTNKFLDTKFSNKQTFVCSAPPKLHKFTSHTVQSASLSKALDKNVLNGKLNLHVTKPNPKPKVKIPDAFKSSLNKEQRAVIESVLSGYSTFFTGPAGSGKSHVLSSILKFNEEVRNSSNLI